MAAAFPAAVRLQRALWNPAEAQRVILQRIIRANQSTEFGREHNFQKIRTVAEYRERVPLRDADDFAAYVNRIGSGMPGVLTEAHVRCLEPSGGSSGATKLVPCTSTLLREFSAATLPWTYDLLRHRPALRDGRAYWVVTPPVRRPARTVGGVPLGLDHDSDYFSPLARRLLDRILATPRSLARAPDIATCRYLTLRALLALPDLSLISVWSPGFLTLLADALDGDFERLIHDLANGTLSVELEPELRRELERALPAHPRRAAEIIRRHGRHTPQDLGMLWPRLALISCWTDGHAARSLTALTRRFPRVEVQGKGLLATEGVVSVPLFEAGGAVAAVTSHFLEFLPTDSADHTFTADQLDMNGTYEVVLTTGGGFYRYRLRDVVRVEGRYHATPVLSFVGRADGASDLAGEKLTPAFVESALRKALRECDIETPFAMLAPSWGEPPGYTLYIEAGAEGADQIAAALERKLRAAHHYSLCRELGQLTAIRGVTVQNGERLYERACLARGQRGGTIKPVALHPGLDWERELCVERALVA